MKGIAAAACLASLVTAAVHADVIYNNFGPGNAYNGSSSWGVYGPNSGQSTLRELAMPFTPSTDYTLSAITVATGDFSGTNSLDLALYDNAPGAYGDPIGQPGAVLESWSGISMQPAGSGQTESVTDAANLVLTGGSQYWLVASPGASDTYAGWYANSTGDDGSMAWGSPGNWSGSVDETRSAYSVTGDPVVTPEPGSFALLGLGLLGLLLRRRKV